MAFLLIRDQIHGDITFSDSEMKLINSSSFQRMRYIKQLAFVDSIYPSAVHNRFQHSLGVCQCVTDMYNAVIKNCPEFYHEGDLELLRMMGLTHDLGHSPFSHASEVLSNVTHEERLKDILKHEKKNIILPNEYGLEGWDLVMQTYLGEGFDYISNSRLRVLHSFLDGFIDADKLDYLERDAINCGVVYGRFDRDALVNNLTVIKDNQGNYKLAIMDKGVQALESFVLARYYMFSQVYTHPFERLTRMQFCNEMKHLLPDGKYPSDVKKFLALDDTKYARRLKFLYNNNYELVYDSEFNSGIKTLLDRRLGNLVICDVVRKAIFRKDKDDETVFVKSSLYNGVIPCSEASPILKNIEFTYIHKLRYYAPKESASAIKSEIAKLLERGGYINV